MCCRDAHSQVVRTWAGLPADPHRVFARAATSIFRKALGEPDNVVLTNIFGMAIEGLDAP